MKGGRSSNLRIRKGIEEWGRKTRMLMIYLKFLNTPF